VVARRVIEAMLVSNNADVCEATEEHERAKLELLLNRYGLEAQKQVASARSLEVYPARMKDGTYKT
jgi:hypothetical protein